MVAASSAGSSASSWSGRIVTDVSVTATSVPMPLKPGWLAATEAPRVAGQANGAAVVAGGPAAGTVVTAVGRFWRATSPATVAVATTTPATDRRTLRRVR